MSSRNAACPCGSGKKFKRCHGLQKPTAEALVQADQQQIVLSQKLIQSHKLSAALKEIKRLPPGRPRFDLSSQVLLLQSPAVWIKADKILQRWQKADPGNAEPIFRRMQIAWRQGLFARALSLLDLLKNRPHKLSAYYRAVALHLSGDLSAAMPSYHQTVVANSKETLTPLEQELDAAIQMYNTTAGEFPGSLKRTLAQLVDAEAEFTVMANALDNWWDSEPELTTLSPPKSKRYALAAYNLGCREQDCYARAEQAMSRFSQALKIQPESHFIRFSWLFAHNYRADLSARAIAEAHFEVGRVICDYCGPPKTDFTPAPLQGRRLRVAYLSSDFHKHSVAYFITPVLSWHDHKKFEIIAYHTNMFEDDLTAKIRQLVDTFRPVGNLSDTALYQQILADKVDILIDLNGYSKWHRAEVLARKVAPLQISWLGYPNTSGMDTIDYRLVDPITDPPSADHLCSETLLRLEKSFSVYMPPDNLPEPGTPGLRPGPFVFASFNNMKKINRPLLKMWAEILALAPESRLLIKNGLVDRKTARRDLLLDMKAVGIDTRRVDFLGRFTDTEEYMACHQQVDLLLDSYPYNGTTTNCDSFIMGVPVLTLCGDSHISRVTSSQLTALGLPEFICMDSAEYIDKAVGFARHPEKLAELSKDLRDRMLNSPLMDAVGFTQQLEALLLQSWVQYENK